MTLFQNMQERVGLWLLKRAGWSPCLEPPRASEALSPRAPEAQNDLITLGELFATHKGRKLSTVSTWAANEGKFLARLKSGQVSCTLRRAANITRWFSQNWPEDLAWPDDIPRPAPKPERAA